MVKVASTDSNQCISKRNILWYLVFTGFAVNYMVRINLNIAIVSMVESRPKNNFSHTSECIKDEDALEKLTQEPTSNRSLGQGALNFTFAQDDSGQIAKAQRHLFPWDEYQQALALGAFFWLHWLTQMPGGVWAQKYGTKLVFGTSNLVGIILCFLIPSAAYMGYKYLIILRVIQGLLLGFAWPSMHNLTAKWIPPNERSRFVTSYLGGSVGAALTYPLCGYIIELWDWESVFYVCGVLGLTWYVAWYFFVFDSPAEHPRISLEEKSYILTSLGESVSKKKAPVPWKDLLRSTPMWLNILAQWGGIWGLFTLMTHAPTYFSAIHGWNIRATGILSGLPHVLRMVWAYLFSQFGDYLLKSNKLSRTNVRKLATAVCCIGQGMFLFGLAYAGCDYTLAIILMTSAVAIHGAVSTGPLASFVDLSPNYASVQLGISGMITVMPGFISPYIVGLLTYNNQTAAQWQKVFWISAVMLIVSGSIYVLFSKSELQRWNSPDVSCDDGAELQELKKKEKNTFDNKTENGNKA